MDLVLPVLPLAAITVLLFLTVWCVSSILRSRGVQSVLASLVVFSIAAAVHVFAWLPYARYMSEAGVEGFFPGTSASTLMVGVLVGAFLPTGVLLVRLLLDSFSANSSQLIFGLNSGRRIESDFSKARTLAADGDIDGAVRQYWQYFEEAPNRVDPMIDAANLLCARGRHEEAADLLRDVLRRVRSQDRLWAQTVFRLAEILRENLGERQAARYLYGRILRRVPDTQWGRLSHARLARGITPDP